MRHPARASFLLFCAALAGVMLCSSSADAATVTGLILFGGAGNVRGAPLIGNDGFLYFTVSANPGIGVRKIARTGNAFASTVALSGPNNSGFPFAGRLVADTAGNLYGTATSGPYPNADGGQVFRVTPDTARTTATIFAGFSTSAGTGSLPSSGLVRDATGNLYGTTSFLTAPGTIFRVGPAGGTPQTLFTFADPATQGAPDMDGIFLAPDGNLYGTTIKGGANDHGTIYRYSPATNQFTTLASFDATQTVGNPPNGLAGELVMDAAGNLYGTTGSIIGNSGGALYRLAAGASSIETLHTFSGGATDGYDAQGLLAIDAAGHLFGTTIDGGTNNAGTAYRFDPDTGQFTLLVSFGTAALGSYPSGGLSADPITGELFGATAGAPFSGTTMTGSSQIFRITDAGYVVAPEPTSLLALASLTTLAGVRRRRMTV